MTMQWVVAAPYFERDDDRWITDAVTSDRHQFRLVPRLGGERNWHQAPARAGLREWSDRARQSSRAIRLPADGIITVFPQLAAAAGGLKLARRDRRPLVAWLFNTEGLDTPVRRLMARQALRGVDRFVVHSTAEIEGYRHTLGLPSERFVFVPLQYGAAVETEAPPGIDQPYVFATGSGYRDYATFFAAVEKLGHRTLVLASDRALAGLRIPANVEILEQISRPEIRRLVRHARVNVVPLTDEGHTAGLVTIVETFRHGRSLVITRRPGIEDYCRDGDTALTAALGDAEAMADAIDAMWTDAGLRRRLDDAAEAFAVANCTDAAAADHLVRILDAVTDQPMSALG